MHCHCISPATISLAALVTLGPPTIHGQASTAKPGSPEIATAGAGEVRLSPQRATVRIGVSTHAVSAAEASAQNAIALGAVLDTLVHSGFQRESLQTLAFGVGPNYDYGNGRKLIDYAAHAAIRVSLSDLNRVGRVIDIALAGGATEVGGIDFDSDSTDAARHLALAQAFAKAHDDAQAVATAAGGRLGPLIEVTTRDENYGAFAMDFAAAAPALEMQMPIVPRDVSVRVAVETRWRLILPRPGRSR